MKLTKQMINEISKTINTDELRKTTQEIDGYTKTIDGDIKNLKTNLTKTLGDESKANDFMGSFMTEESDNFIGDCEDFGDHEASAYGKVKIINVFGRPARTQSACWGGLTTWTIAGDDCGSDGIYIIDASEWQPGVFELVKVWDNENEERQTEILFVAYGIDRNHTCYDSFVNDLYHGHYDKESINGDINDLIEKALKFKPKRDDSSNELMYESLIKKHLINLNEDYSGYKDLFEYYNEQPPKLRLIVDKYSEMLENGVSYDILNSFRDEVNNVGYTFDFGLDAQPYGLRPIGVNLNQLTQ